MTVPTLTEPGRVIAGRYRLLSVLGHGGMGTVWRAHDDVLDRLVAIKEILPPPDVTAEESQSLRERTLREARIAARLGHQNVVTIYDVVEDAGEPWIVMELVEAHTLRDIVELGGPLPTATVASVGLQLLAALRAAHDLGIVHRDVKPGNVLIDASGRAVLADFGIARAVDSPSLTRSGVLLGSPSYTAPERARGDRGGPESDLWALGATLYTAVEGRQPYERNGAWATLNAVVSTDPDPPELAGPLWPVLSELMRRDPARRLRPEAAEQMLRKVAQTADPEGTLPLGPAEAARAARPADSDPADAGPARAGPVGAGPVGAGPVGAGPVGAGPVGAGPWAVSGLAEAEQTRVLHRQRGLADRPGGAPRTGVPATGVPDADVRGSDAPARTDRAPDLLPGLRPGRAGPDSRRRGFWFGVLVAVVLVLAGGVAFALRQAGQPGSTPGSGQRSGAGPGPSASPGGHGQRGRGRPGQGQGQGHGKHGTGQPGSGSQGHTPPGQTGQGAGPGGQPGGATSALPPGYYRYRDPTGFSIGVPPGWSVSHRGHYVYITPASGGEFLLIDQTDHPKPNPLADWRQQEAARRSTYPGYRLIRLAAVRYAEAERAADWEFTYTGSGGPTHVLNRNVLANPGHAYALYWSTPASAWGTDYHYFRSFAATFTPAGGVGRG